MRRVALALVPIALLSWTSPARAGYTHYWKWLKEPDAKTLEITLDEMNRLAVERRAILSDAQGWTADKATFRGRCEWGDAGEMPCIVFNGILEQQHETFGFPLAPFTNNPDFSFVKTAKKPYDEVAAACLIVAHDHFPFDVLDISSDGGWPGEFREGIRLYEHVLRRDAHDPLTPRAAREDAAAVPPVEDLTRGQVLFRWGIFGLMGIVLLGALLWRRR